MTQAKKNIDFIIKKHFSHVAIISVFKHVRSCDVRGYRSGNNEVLSCGARRREDWYLN